MSWRFLILASAFAACVPAPDDGQESISARRDSLPGDQTFDTPYKAGLLAGDRLGERLVNCDEEFLSSGSSVMWLESTPLLYVAPSPPDNVALSCTQNGSVHNYFAGGPSGLWKLVTISGWLRLIGDAGVRSIERHPSQQLWVLALGTDSQLMFADAGRYPLGTPALEARWSRDGSLFAVVNTNHVQLFEWTGTMLSQRGLWVAPSGTQFAGPVALGEFNPRFGLEAAMVMNSGEVLVINQYTPQPLLRIPFGRTVSADYDYLNSAPLDALLVGDPGQSRVVRMVGDASVESWSTTASGTEFGTSISSKVTFGGDRMVGAPAWAQNSGALFLFPGGSSLLVGDPYECTVGDFCSTPSGVTNVCNYGQCLGGVACMGLISGCPPGWDCLDDQCVSATPVDAGIMRDASVDFDGGVTIRDAGSFDGGDPAVDGGGNPSLDAGTSTLDAGNKPDGGGGVDPKDGGETTKDDGGTSTAPVQFAVSACQGCSASGVNVLAMLGVIFALRRRRGQGQLEQ
ncbi:MAG: hypothetical protein QM817_28355 [Archangium sp.]